MPQIVLQPAMVAISHLRSRSQTGTVVVLHRIDHILDIAGYGPHAIRHPPLDGVHPEGYDFRGQSHPVGQSNRVVIKVGEVLLEVISNLKSIYMQSHLTY